MKNRSSFANWYAASSLIQTILSVPESIASMSPVQPEGRLADYTAGRELHPAPKNFLYLVAENYDSLVADLCQP